MRKQKYCLLGYRMAEEQFPNVKDDVATLSGLWLWAKVFGKFGKRGDAKVIKMKGEIEEYDVVHLNLTPGNLALPQVVREQLGHSSDTKLIVNIDFEVDNWAKIWQHPILLKNAMDCADLVFHVEPVGVSMLEHIFGKSRKIYCIPHPVDVEGLDKLKREERDASLVTVYHRHTPDITIPYWAQMGVNLFKILLGCSEEPIPSAPLFDRTTPYMKFLDAMELMSKAKIGYHSHPGYCFGRAVVEFASMAVPCVCSNTIESCRRIYPELACNHFDIKRQNELLKALNKNDEKYVEIFTKGYERAGYYSMKNSYKRLLEALEDIEKGAGHYNGIYATSKRYAGNYHHAGYESLWNQFVDEIIGYNIIDLGCGTGQFAEFLRDKKYSMNYIGVDFSEEAIKKANERQLPRNFSFNKRRITPSFVKKLSGRNTIIIALEFLEHVKQDKEILSASSLPMVATVPTFNDVAHVRYFPSYDDVANRYKEETGKLGIAQYGNYHILKKELSHTWCSVIKKDDIFEMFYSLGYWVINKREYIGYKTSKNGIIWEDHGPILRGGDWDEAIWCPMVWDEEGTRHMVYSGSDKSYKNVQVGHATFVDGEWIKDDNPIFNCPDEWAHNNTESWGVMKHKNKYYLMFNTLYQRGNVRECSIASGTDLNNLKPVKKTPIWTKGRFCGFEFKKDDSFFALMPHYVGAKFEIELWKATTPEMIDTKKIGIYLPAWERGHDTPYILSNIDRDITDEKELAIYYAHHRDNTDNWITNVQIERDIEGMLREKDAKGK